MQNAFKWNPGDEFELSMSDEKGMQTLFSIRNEIDIYNQSFLHCLKTNAKLYYENNGKTFSTLNYLGSKKSSLFYFYRSFYKVVLSEHSGLSVKTRFPVHHLYRFPILTIQDFLVPFGLFLKGRYKLSYIEPEQTFNPQKIELISKIEGRNKQHLFSAEIVVHKNREIIIHCDTMKKSKNKLKWENKLYA